MHPELTRSIRLGAATMTTSLTHTDPWHCAAPFRAHPAETTNHSESLGTDLGSANGLAALRWKVRDAEPGALPPPATSLLATKPRKLSLATLVGGFRGQSEGGEQEPYHVKFFGRFRSDGRTRISEFTCPKVHVPNTPTRVRIPGKTRNPVNFFFALQAR